MLCGCCSFVTKISSKRGFSVYRESGYFVDWPHPMSTPCRQRLWIIAIPVTAICFSAIPAYAQGMFGPVPTFSDLFPPGGYDGGWGEEGVDDAGRESMFSSVPDVLPRVGRGTGVSSSGLTGGMFGRSPSVAGSGFGPTFSTGAPVFLGLFLSFQNTGHAHHRSEKCEGGCLL